MEDIAVSNIIATNPSEDLDEVLKKMVSHNLDSLPVVKEQDPKIRLGMLDHYVVIQSYNQLLKETNTGTQGQGID